MIERSPSNSVKLERLVEAVMKLGRVQGNETTNYGALEFNIRLGFLTDEVLSLSGLNRELRRLRTSKKTEIIEGAVRSLRKEKTINEGSIRQALADEIGAVKAQPKQKYTIAWPVAVSLPFAEVTSEGIDIDNRHMDLLDFVSFGENYLPRSVVKGSDIVETKPLSDAGIDVLASQVGSGPNFLVTEVYARDPWYAAMESGTSVDLFLSLADLSTGFTLLERYPLSIYPNPSVCFVFTDPRAVPVTYGKSKSSYEATPFAFHLDRFREVVRTLNSIERTGVWPTIRSSLLTSRRAMYQLNRLEALVDFWTACELAVACGDRNVRDDEAAKRMEKIFRGTWYEFPIQVHAFLDARNAILHEGDHDVQRHHIFFAHFLFENLLAILVGYARRGKSALDIRTIFEAARLSEQDRKRFLDALQELTGSPGT
jgi:hypothetical protein